MDEIVTTTPEAAPGNVPGGHTLQTGDAPSVGRDDPGAPPAPAQRQGEGAQRQGEGAQRQGEGTQRQGEGTLPYGPDAAAEPDPAWAAILSQADDLRCDYPSFDLAAELADERFGMLLAGLESLRWPDALRTAYQCIHHDELMTAALGYAVAHTRSAMADSIRTARARPVEGSGASVTDGADPAHLTPGQIEEVRRRVMLGQRVSF